MPRLLGLAAVVIALAGGSLLIGAVDVLRVFNGPPDLPARQIVLELRLPRALLATLVGLALGATGAAYQALFRNPLADPFIIGSSSGAAFGVTLALLFGLGTAALGAFAGALTAVALVYAVAAAGRMPPGALLLAGTAISTMLSALVWLALAFSDQQLNTIISWLMGGLAGRGWAEVRAAAPLVLPAVAALTLLGRPLDALACGDDTARALGLDVPRATGLLLGASSVAVAAAVAAGGVVGFVGLVAPHLARPLVGGTHRRLVPASALTGAGLVIAADTVARTALRPLEIPLGVLTSLLGGPFFLFVLARSLRSR